MAMEVAILGAGIAGLTSALALTKNLPLPAPKITVFEVRPAPSTIGGAVNLTPKALRYLDHLGVWEILLAKGIGVECRTIEIFDLYTGQKGGQVDFRGRNGNGLGKSGREYFARRVMRWQLQEVLLEVCRSHANISVEFDRNVTDIQEPPGGRVELMFEDGTQTSSDILLGCDGIHSATRNLVIESQRKPRYSGIAVVMATAKLRPETTLKWETTGLATSRRGSLMCSFFENNRTEQYIAAVIELPEVDSREGWRVKGSDQEAIKSDVSARFVSSSMPELGTMITDAGHWTLYPVYTLPPKGKWISPGSRCILLGDAAHAMAPQGESTGICIEDAIVFSRALTNHRKNDIKTIFSAYEALRRPYVDAAVQQAGQRWETVRDSGWLFYQIKRIITPWFLWWTATQREQEFAEDHSELIFDLPS